MAEKLTAAQRAEIAKKAVSRLEPTIKPKISDLIGSPKSTDIVDRALSPKPKGTQAGHAVTNNDNHTKPISPAQKQAEAKRPAVGTDKSAAKQYGSRSWNNGYTN